MQQPLTVEESMKHFVTPVGFEVKLFVSEPQLEGKPIYMTWDERGRLWVCETYDYPNELQPEGQGHRFGVPDTDPQPPAITLGHRGELDEEPLAPPRPVGAPPDHAGDGHRHQFRHPGRLPGRFATFRVNERQPAVSRPPPRILPGLRLFPSRSPWSSGCWTRTGNHS